MFDDGQAMLFGERQNSLDAANRGLALPLMEQAAELADVSSNSFGSCQQLLRGQRSLRSTITLLDCILSTLVMEVFAQQLAGFGIEQPHIDFVPLDVDLPTDPTRRRSVVGGIHFD